MSSRKNNILIPRRIEGRAERWKMMINRQIQQYIKNGSVGDLNLVETPIEKLPDNLIKVGGSHVFPKLGYHKGLPAI